MLLECAALLVRRAGLQQDGAPLFCKFGGYRCSGGKKGRQEMPTVSSVTSTIKTPENEEHGEAIVGRWSRLQSTSCPSSTTTVRDLSPRSC